MSGNNKDKELIEELRQNDKQWSDQYTRLQKALLRLAFNFYGRDNTLDNKLDLFRNNVRNNKDFDRSALIEDILAAVLKLDHEQNTQTITQTADRALALEQLLDRMDVPESALSSVNALKLQLKEQGQQSDVLKLINDTADVLSEALKNSQPDPGSEEPSDYVSAQVSLVKLLEQLIVPITLEPHYSSIQDKLQQASEIEDIDKALDAVIDLITKIQLHLQNEVAEVEKFLKNIIVKLQTLESHLETTRSLQNESLSDSELLSVTLSDTLTDIRTNVDESQDLNTLKNQVNKRLGDIQENVNTFLESERQRNSQSEETVDALSSKLSDLENETVNLRKAMLEESKRALTDALTGLPNRLAYEEHLAAEYSRWKRIGTPLTLLVLDIDHFKKVNDTYGHSTGDKVLSNIGNILSKHLREIDFIARFGGEEFVMILPNTDLDSTMGVANKIRKKIEECRFRYQNKPVSITISSGAAGFSKGDTPEDVFVRADTALYSAKHNGRNCCASEMNVQTGVQN